MNILKLLSPPSLHATFALFTILISGAPQKEQDPQEREIRMAKRQHLQLWHGQWDKGLAISLPPTLPWASFFSRGEQSQASILLN